ncbi:MAG: T9SS type A sorting domain-containing protein [Bacteroidales bacterium]|jgi:aminopeptidase N|nr:T9SS type A sorting domain-containing protein [Bacteroidales bacterium]
MKRTGNYTLHVSFNNPPHLSGDASFKRRGISFLFSARDETRRATSLLFCLLLSVFMPSTFFAQTKADTIHITHYNINLEIKDFVNQEIKGNTELEIEAKFAPLQKVYLHLYSLMVDSIMNENVKIEGYSHTPSQLEIPLPFTAVGQKQTIRIYYQGKPTVNLGWGGFFFQKNVAYNMGVGMSTFPHSIGRVWYPCVDEFTDKSTYTFNITTEADKKAICGGKLTDSIPVGDGIRWTWKLDNPIPTYLASVAVGEYKSYTDTFHSISGKELPIEIYANSATIDKVPGSFANLKTFIRTYEKRWGPCRWQRVGYVGVPFTDGAMEHANNIALPSSYITGNTNNQRNQDIIAHELAHSWFGNLLTCKNSTDMWINEGFARYGEYLCYETLDPTLQKYQTEIKKLHFAVLKNDNGQYALDNLPITETYNTTIVYDKGGLIVHTLRNYMGDELHFSSIKQLLDENKYSNLNSEQFFEKLSQISGINLHDFYMGWVHQKGFLNFNIDSVKRKAERNNIYEIACKQKLYKADYFANSNRIEVEFLSASGSRVLKTLQFSGESAKVDVELPFEPVFWAIDPNGKMSDACFDFTQTITKIENINFANAKFSVKVNEVSDTSILRIEYNPVPPTALITDKPNIYKISDKHFWRIGFYKYNEMQAQFSFTYNNKVEEVELLHGYSYTDLVLLYRKDASYNWKTMPATVTSPNIQTGLGTIEVDFILPGEYTLGIGEYVGLNEWGNNIRIYPNPTTGHLIIDNGQFTIINVEVFDIFERRQSSNLQFISSSQHQINISHLPPGIYFVKIQTEIGTKMQKLIKN